MFYNKIFVAMKLCRIHIYLLTNLLLAYDGSKNLLCALC